MNGLPVPAKQLLALKCHPAVGASERTGGRLGCGVGVAVYGVNSFTMPFESDIARKGAPAFGAVDEAIIHVFVPQSSFNPSQ